MAYNKTKIFTALGKGIKKFNMLRSTFKPYLETVQTEWVALLNDTDGERRLLNVISALNASDQSQLDAIQSAVKAALSGFMKDEIRLDLSVTQKTLSQIIDLLYDAMIDQTPDDTVLQNICAVTNSQGGAVPLADNDNTGNGTCSTPSLTQQCHDLVNVELECYDATVPAKFYVRLSFRGGVSINIGTATSGVAFSTLALYQAGSIPIDWGFSFTLTAGGVAWAVGDKWYFSTSITTPGKFQYYFVQEWHRALPSAVSPAQTIDEAWAT
jgi:hypothetical protein